MNSNHDERPTTITVHEYYTQNFIAKVAKKECKVSVPGYAGSWIEDVEDVGGMYFVKFQDHEGVHSFNFAPDDNLTVYWLPATDRDAAAPLLPQTVNTIRYGTPEFAALESDYYEAEIARLQAEVERLRVFVARVASRNYGSQSPMGFWITISQDARHLISNDVERPVKEIFPVGFENDEERILYEPPSPKASTNSDVALAGYDNEPDHK